MALEEMRRRKAELGLTNERRAELIDGTLFEMEAPNGKHQAVIVAIAFILESFVCRHKGPCHVEVSPRDVRLDRDDKTVVQPDVMVDPETETVIVYHFEAGTVQLYSFDDTVPVAVWDGACRVDFEESREDLKTSRRILVTSVVSKPAFFTL